VIVVDTSAIVAVLFGEPGAERIEQLLVQSECSMSQQPRWNCALSLRPAGSQLLTELLRRIDIRLVEVDESIAEEAVVAWRRFGKGRH